MQTSILAESTSKYLKCFGNDFVATNAKVNWLTRAHRFKECNPCSIFSQQSSNNATFIPCAIPLFNLFPWGSEPTGTCKKYEWKTKRPKSMFVTHLPSNSFPSTGHIYINLSTFLKEKESPGLLKVSGSHSPLATFQPPAPSALTLEQNQRVQCIDKGQR